MSENAILSGPEVSAGFAEVMYCLIGLFCKRPIRTPGMKHVEVQHHFIREKLEDGVITAEYVPTGDQVADVLTKGLAREKHDRFVKGLGLE